MKKTLLLVCMMLSVVMAFAQETKKVAILEVVDRQGNVSYANKLILRSNLAKAITNTPGYEAYDRTDMDAILGEQNFQRTGMVSEEQIKKLGEMTGAKYVLVAEAALVDATNMYITAKLLDVETARTEMTDNQMMGTNAREIQKGCQLLAANLVKPITVVKVEQQRAASTAKTVKHESKSVQQNQTAIPSGTIVKVSRNEYRMDGTVMDKKAYENFIYQNCPAAWKKYKNGKNAVATGWTFFAIGAAMQGCWALAITADYRDYTMQELGIGLGSAGAGLAGVGLFTLIGGYASKSAALKTYNKKCAASAPLTFSVTAGQNGIGLAMNF